MRIQNNTMAMNTHRMYMINNSNIQKSAQKLSSGYRINSAGDDAAGLAIYEKMRSQIRGLNMASKNSQDAISLVQTAEGALQEVHSMLQRMNELAVQSATGTNQEFDRIQLDKEFKQLKREVNDVAEQTTFNNMKLLDGTHSNEGPKRSAQTAGIYASLIDEPGKPATSMSFTINLAGIDLGASGVVTEIELGTNVTIGGFNVGTGYTIGGGAAIGANAGGAAIASAIADALKNSNDWTVTANGSELTFASKHPGTGVTAPDSADTISFTTTGTFGSNPLTNDKAYNISKDKPASGPQTSTIIEFDVTKLRDGDNITIDLGNETLTAPWNKGMKIEDLMVALTSGASADISVDGNTMTIHGIEVEQSTIDGDFKPATPDPKSYGIMKIQVGALEGEQLGIEIKAMNSYGLGIDDTDLSFQEGAGKAITAMRGAVNMVSDQRALLGAMQNRLEHKISNLDNTSENLQSAESRIRDADVAKEMSNYTKSNILSQASTAMLAQANAAPQGVLSLLQQG